ncbi:DNA helicase/exodeoxyribonuclease V, subunit A [Lachnospiraceae bacterium C7]|nr:DNA helicase/exodeoxyribonuclease V, subunit A [Lachnospiraceae bacterium C7]
MGVKWTSEQQKVIDTRNKNVLVSAAAGSGKTAVLVERIIKMITDEKKPVDIDKLLVVTFTKAAAAEMRERIGNAIEKLHEEILKKDQADAMIENLEKQMTLIHNAKITTIDSFCNFIVRNHFGEINLEPNFRIGDQGEIKLLEGDVIAKVFEDFYAQKDEKFLRLIDTYSDKRSDEEVKKMVLAIYRASASQPWPREWIESLRKAYSTEYTKNIEDLPVIKDMVYYAKVNIKEFCESYKECLETIDREPILEKYKEIFASELEALEALLDLDGYSELRDGINKEIFAKRLPAIKVENGSTEKKIKDAINDKRKAIKEKINKQMKGKDFALDSSSIKKQMENSSPFVDELIEVTFAFMDALEEEKKSRHVADFGDVEHYALKILVDENTKEPTTTAKEYQETFDEIMIDEYQDSNDVQEWILQAISKESAGGNNTFMVGDVKQSIYRFRLAKPELFMHKYKTFSLDDESTSQRIDLAKNFRSRQEVVDSVNDIFFKLMNEDLGKVNYDAKAALYCGASYLENEGCNTEVLIVDSEINEEDELTAGKEGKTKELSLLGNADSTNVEAVMIAKKIKEILKEQKVTDKETGELRQAKLSDIVILLRSLKKVGEQFAKVLNNHGIPATVQKSTGYFDATEVQVMLSFLQILDNPYQDIPLTTVLKSKFAGIDDLELAELRIRNKSISFSQIVVDYATTLNLVWKTHEMEIAVEKAKQEQENRKDSLTMPTEFKYDESEVFEKTSMPEEDYRSLLELIQCRESTEEKLCIFWRKYEKIRAMMADTPTHDLIQKIFNEYNYLNYVAAMPAGSKREANLKKLLEKAIAYEQTMYKGVFHFVRYIEQLKKYEIDEGEADVIGENTEAVRIMTIHQSKGLEFPIVFVSNISKKFNQSDTRSKMIIHPDLGIGIDEITLKPRTKRNSFFKNIIKDKIVQENLGEELRVLYVALTRAKEKLILTGSIKDAQKNFSKYTGQTKEGQFLPYSTRRDANSYMDWIIPAILSYPNKYEVDIVNLSSLVYEAIEEAVINKIQEMDLRKKIINSSSDLISDIEKQLDFEYPYLDQLNKKSKYSVSELKKLSMEQAYDENQGEAETPTFLKELSEAEKIVPKFILKEREKKAEELEKNEKVNEKNDADSVFIQLEFDQFLQEELENKNEQDEAKEQQTDEEGRVIVPPKKEINLGARRGTAMHRLLQCMNFKEILNIDRENNKKVFAYVKRQIENAVKEELMTTNDAKLIYINGICDFVRSDVALRMAKADEKGDLYKEKPFVMDYNDALLQGIIDVFWVEDDGIVLLDYKTDSVKTGQELVMRYEMQINLYAEALSRIFSTKEHKVKTKEKLLYSFKLKEVVEV